MSGRRSPSGCRRCRRGAGLFAFYDWCAQNDDIPELLSLARTVSRWEDEIVAAVLTGVTNAVSESLNRLAKLEARMAYGFRNPASQRLARPDGLHQGFTTALTTRNQEEDAAGNQTATRSRLTSKSH